MQNLALVQKEKRIVIVKEGKFMPNWLKGSALVLFGAFLWGTLAAFSKEASTLHPVTGAAVRAFLAALGCFVWFGVRSPDVLKVELKDLALLFVYGGASAGFLYSGFMTALTYLSVAATEVIFYTFPLLRPAPRCLAGAGR